MATKLNTIPAEESDTLLTKKPAASLKFQAHMGAANASTKAKKIVGAVAAAALVLGVLAATAGVTGVAPTRTNLSSKSKAQQIKFYADPSKCLTAKDGIINNFAALPPYNPPASVLQAASLDCQIARPRFGGQPSALSRCRNRHQSKSYLSSTISANHWDLIACSARKPLRHSNRCSTQTAHSRHNHAAQRQRAKCRNRAAPAARRRPSTTRSRSPSRRARSARG